MKHLFLPYSLSFLAKQNGFNEPCLAFYSASANAGDNNFEKLWFPKVLDKAIDSDIVCYSDLTNEKSCLSPTWQQIKQWLWDKYRIYTVIEIINWAQNKYSWAAYKDGHGILCSEENCATPLLAEEKAIGVIFKYLNFK